MNTRTQILLAVVSLAAVGACSSSSNSATDAGSGGSSMSKTVPPSDQTKAVWAQIQGYETWPMFPENTTPKPSAAHMGMFVVAHYNPIVGQAITSHALPLADGALIVKDNFAHADDKTPMAITLMSKQSGKWYFVEATPDGMVMTDPTGAALEGTDVKMCTACHDASKNDGVVTHTF